jgi:hypothetical protein
MTDEAGKTHANCLEVHDTCVSKLMAGREKDFIFIKEFLERGLSNMEVFISRAATISDMPQSAALLPRLEKLAGYLKGARSSLDLRPLQRLIADLRSRP